MLKKNAVTEKEDVKGERRNEGEKREREVRQINASPHFKAGP